MSRLLDRLLPKAVDAALQRVDLNSTIARHVDIDALVESVDLNQVIGSVDIDAIAARLDVAAVINQLDLVALTEQILNAIDIPEVIRESTNSVASEGVRGGPDAEHLGRRRRGPGDRPGPPPSPPAP